MDLVVCIPTYKKFDLLKKCIESAEAGTKKPLAYVIVDNSNGDLDQTPYDHLDNMDILVLGRNVGVPAAWNNMIYFILQKYPNAACIIANDDIEFLPDTLEKFDNAMSAEEKHVIYCTSGLKEANAFSLFGLHPEYFLNTVGPFDQRIWPAYFEDGDMHRRMQLLGYCLFRIPDCGCDHIGSATIATYTPEERQIHDTCFRRNTLYYVFKWGGTPDSTEGFNREMFDKPFGGSAAVERAAMELLTRVFGF
jgi:GT2 family glycosyltransferase